MDSKSCSFSKKIFMNTRYTSVLGKIIFIVTNNEADYQLSLWLLFFWICIWFTHIIYICISDWTKVLIMLRVIMQHDYRKIFIHDNWCMIFRNMSNIIFSFKKKWWVLNKLTILINRCTLSFPERLKNCYLK